MVAALRHTADRGRTQAVGCQYWVMPILDPCTAQLRCMPPVLDRESLVWLRLHERDAYAVRDTGRRANMFGTDEIAAVPVLVVIIVLLVVSVLSKSAENSSSIIRDPRRGQA